MNKRLEKIFNRIKEGNTKGAVRRDQIKKAVEENGFDYMVYEGYDEVYDVEPVRAEAKVENIKDYWWRGADLWATVKNTDNKETLIVTMKFGYSYINLCVEINKEENIKTNKEEVINVNNEDVEITYNEEKNGIEIKFSNKPETETLNELKENGFRWHRAKKVWYAKDTEERRSFINTLVCTEDKENENVIEDNAEVLNALIESDSNISFDNVEVEEVKEDIFVNALVPYINKNDTIELNNEEIKAGSELNLFKVSHMINLTEEQYNYFTNNLLDDYSFLRGLGGWIVDDNGDFECYTGVIITCENKETLLVDPSGSYARYLNKIVKDVDGNLSKKINLVLDNELYKEAYEDINNSNLYVVNFTKKRVIEDARIILNGAFNDIQVVTGLTIKEMIKEGLGINVLNLEEYKGNLNAFKEGLNKVDNGFIINLMPSEIDKELNKIKMLSRLESELKRSLNY